ncbi:MAG TPA: energy transducer TonB [Novosphingobium sp.]|nr:energy transducer TonB [Novosphingobium sp.]
MDSERLHRTGQVRIGVDRRTRWMAAAAVAAIHVAAIVALVNAFGVDAVVATVRSVAAFAVPLPSPPPPPPQPARAPDKAAPAAPRAVPKQVVAPKPKVVIPRPAQPAPPAASTGTAAAAGASTAGSGSGAGGSGSGAGGGRAVVAQQAVKIAGDIVSARDYPRESRDARIGHSVVILLTVGIDGWVKACRVVRPSPVPEADTITCRLASERFRFRPARDQNGDPIESSYGWRQSWFTRG